MFSDYAMRFEAFPYVVKCLINMCCMLKDNDCVNAATAVDNLPAINIRFCNNQLDRKITKKDDRMHNIIRCCTSRHKLRGRCCTFKRRSRCIETFVMYEWFRCRSKSHVLCVNCA